MSQNQLETPAPAHHRPASNRRGQRATSVHAMQQAAAVPNSCAPGQPHRERVKFGLLPQRRPLQRALWQRHAPVAQEGENEGKVSGVPACSSKAAAEH